MERVYGVSVYRAALAQGDHHRVAVSRGDAANRTLALQAARELLARPGAELFHPVKISWLGARAWVREFDAAAGLGLPPQSLWPHDGD